MSQDGTPLRTATTRELLEELYLRSEDIKESREAQMIIRHATSRMLNLPTEVLAARRVPVDLPNGMDT